MEGSPPAVATRSGCGARPAVPAGSGSGRRSTPPCRGGASASGRRPRRRARGRTSPFRWARAGPRCTGRPAPPPSAVPPVSDRKAVGPNPPGRSSAAVYGWARGVTVDGSGGPPGAPSAPCPSTGAAGRWGRPRGAPGRATRRPGSFHLPGRPPAPPGEEPPPVAGPSSGPRPPPVRTAGLPTRTGDPPGGAGAAAQYRSLLPPSGAPVLASTSASTTASTSGSHGAPATGGRSQRAPPVPVSDGGSTR